MNVRAGETKPFEVTNSTVNGVLFNIYMIGLVNNVPLNAADFISTNVTLKATLHRQNGQISICNDNLQNLVIFSVLNYGINDWLFGNRLVAEGAGNVGQYSLSGAVLFDHINVKDNDVLMIEVQALPGCFSADINTATSLIEFEMNYSMGYEMGTPQIRSMVFQTNTNYQDFNLGDNVAKIMFLQLDKTDIAPASLAVTSFQLQSKEVSYGRNFMTQFAAYRQNNQAPRLGYRTAPDATLANPSVPYLPYLPQTLILHCGTQDRPKLINQAKMSCVCAGTNVNASQNYLIWQSYIMTAATLQRAVNRAAKHDRERAMRLR